MVGLDGTQQGNQIRMRMKRTSRKVMRRRKMVMRRRVMTRISMMIMMIIIILVMITQTNSLRYVPSPLPSLTLSLPGANRSDPSLRTLYRPGVFFFQREEKGLRKFQLQPWLLPPTISLTLELYIKGVTQELRSRSRLGCSSSDI